MVSRVILCCDDYSTRVLAFWGSHVPRRVLVAEPMEEAGPEAAVRLRARTTAPGDIVQKTTWIIPYWGAMADCGQLQGCVVTRGPLEDMSVVVGLCTPLQQVPARKVDGLVDSLADGLWC
ncbi:hypothetical protein PF004_g15622 [Phytophthora fragariae]|uniref:Uncharacterized protein n=2 Tax=Phytophthora fragariae TaxID=53985 RepID=A0A6A3JRG6_9STRA|nr:hypothetical protein PF011_g15491 [Phytophthora fragariae]KAE9212456.1 hypothetical protein PF004_g15622 [Phytophthora fragariae]